jgi:xanthine dehydrogenase accessory factor
MMVSASGEMKGSWPGDPGVIRRVKEEFPGLLKENRTERRVWPAAGQDPGGSRVEFLVEPLCSEPTVYLFGAGHVSEQIAPLARKVQFKVVVLDDRDMFANRDRFPEADEIIVSPFETCFDRLPIDESSYIIIVTRGHLYDGVVLEQAVKTKARYIGMIGSRKKIRVLYQNLIEKGVARETLEQVRAPIGLEIHSETPEEIAVSIVAQLIQVRGEAV